MTAQDQQPAKVNLGGEGEIDGVINQQGKWVLAAEWTSSQLNLSLQQLCNQGHRFVMSDNRFLPFSDESIDEVFTNSVPVDGNDTWLGPPVQSSEVRRILRPGGHWFLNDVLVFTKS